MRSFLSLFVACSFLLSIKANGQDNALRAMLSDTTLPGASYSICMMDVATGDIIFEHDMRRILASASVMKLYPTATALTLLGPDYRFRTTIGYTGIYNRRNGVLKGDLVIRGGGDPALGSSLFADHYGDIIGQWAAALSDSVGLRRVTGRVAAAASIYDFLPIPGGWGWDDLAYAYGAGVYDINYHDNTYKMYVSGGNEGQPATIDSVEPAGRGSTVISYLISSGSSDEGYAFNAPYVDKVWLAGTVPANKQISMRVSLTDPPLAVTRLLDSELEKTGVKIKTDPSTSRVEIPGDTSFSIMYSTWSPPLSEIITVTNHESMNMYAEQLCKHLGYEIKGQGSFQAGLEVIREFLDSIGCEPGDAMILDASGLSANNNISSLMTVRLLRYMYLEKNRDIFVASLPEAGVSGTMKNYFRGDVFKGRVRAKTGSISGVRSFAGYLTMPDGRVMAFAMLSNGFTGPWRRVTDHMEKIIEEMILNNQITDGQEG